MFLIVLMCVSLVGCGNGQYLQDKENEVVVHNRKIESVLTLYSENMSFVSKNTQTIWDSLFLNNGAISEDLFYNDSNSVDFMILSQQITKMCKKNDLEINQVRNESEVYSFFNDTDGSVLMYYVIPLGNSIKYIEITIQNGLIYSVEY